MYVVAGESLWFKLAGDSRVPLSNVNAPRCVANDETVTLNTRTNQQHTPTKHTAYQQKRFRQGCAH